MDAPPKSSTHPSLDQILAADAVGAHRSQPALKHGCQPRPRRPSSFKAAEDRGDDSAVENILNNNLRHSCRRPPALRRGSSSSTSYGHLLAVALRRETEGRGTLRHRVRTQALFLEEGNGTACSESVLRCIPGRWLTSQLPQMVTDRKPSRAAATNPRRSFLEITPLSTKSSSPSPGRCSERFTGVRHRVRSSLAGGPAREPNPNKRPSSADGARQGPTGSVESRIPPPGLVTNRLAVDGKAGEERWGCPSARQHHVA